MSDEANGKYYALKTGKQIKLPLLPQFIRVRNPAGADREGDETIPFPRELFTGEEREEIGAKMIGLWTEWGCK